MGYHRAGFDEIVGIDIVPQPNYPFMFIQADALAPPVDIDAFDLIHASPPCQAYVPMAANRWGNSRWPDLIAPTRALLTGQLYVIENVTGARKAFHNPVVLTGEMFGLASHRRRLFELGKWYTLAPHQPQRRLNALAIYGKPDGRRLTNRRDGTDLHAWGSLKEGRDALGVPWMTDELEVREAIPPAYTEYIGAAFLEQQNVA